MDADDSNTLMGLIQLFLGFMGSLYVCIEVLEWGWLVGTLAAVAMAIPVAAIGWMIPALCVAGLGRACVWAYEHLDPSLRRQRAQRTATLQEREAVQSTLRAAVAEDLDRHFAARDFQSLEVTVTRREDGSLRISPRSDQRLSDNDIDFVRELLVAKLPHLFGNALGRLMAAHHFAAMVLWQPSPFVAQEA